MERPWGVFPADSQLQPQTHKWMSSFCPQPLSLAAEDQDIVEQSQDLSFLPYLGFWHTELVRDNKWLLLY